MSEKSKITRHHHYVPRGYLRGFSKPEEDGGERIQIHAKPLNKSDKEFTASVADVAVKKHYNTLRSPAIFDRADEAEHQLQTIESDAIPIIRRIEKRDLNFDYDQRRLLSRYLALQATRVPRVREAHKDFLDFLESRREKIKRPEDIQRVVDSFEGLNYPDLDPSEVWENLNNPQVDFKKYLELQYLQNTFYSAEREFHFFQMRQWKFVYFNEAHLITSDNPISVYFPKGAVTKQNSTMGGVSGFLFPVARTVALSIGDYPRINHLSSKRDTDEGSRVIQENMEGKRDKAVQGSGAVARHYNAMTAFFAHKYLYCHPDDANFDAVELKKSFTMYR